VDRPSLQQHVSQEALRDFFLGVTSSDEAQSISDHLAICLACRTAFVEVTEVSVVPDGIEQHSPISQEPAYQLLEVISHGGMGIVHLAVDRRTGRKVAIKKIAQNSYISQSQDRKQRLIREAHALTKLRHPNIVQFIDVIFIEDTPALVMEYVRGIPLNCWIRDEKPDIAACVQMMLILAEAVEHAHHQGVVHCDLKPQNVLVTQDDSPWGLKLIDFGLAKLTDEEWKLTYSGDILGTPAYMAPEQTTGRMIAASPAIDVYGLGAIFYELLLQRGPFEASNTAILLAKVASDPPVRPRRLRAEIPQPIEIICLKCLEKQPGDRYLSAGLFASDLRAFLERRPIAAKAPGVATRAVRRLRRHRSSVFLLSAIAAILLVGSSVFWRLTKSRTDLQSSMKKVVDEKLVAESRAEQAEEGVLEELRVSLEETTERLFGSTPEKESMEWESLQRIAKRWERFAERIDDSASSQLVRSEAMMRLGSIEATLGNLKAAEEKIRFALEHLSVTDLEPERIHQKTILEAETYWRLAMCLFDRGEAVESEQAFRQAIARAEIVAEGNTTEHKRLMLLPKILRDYGVMLTRLNRLDDAEAALERSSRLLESLATAADGRIDPTASQVAISRPAEQQRDSASLQRKEILQQLCSSRHAQATVMRARGSSARSITMLESTHRLLRQLESDFSEDSIILRLLFVQNFSAGMSQLEAGDFQASKASFLEARKYQNKLIEMYPRRQDLRKNYGSLCGSLGVVSVRLGQLNDALGYTRESRNVQAELAEEYPDILEYRIEKAKSISNLIAILASANRLEEASALSSEVMELLEALRKEYPDQPEYTYSLAASSNILGTVFGRLHDEVQANVMFERSRVTYSELIQTNPSVARYRTGLAGALVASGDYARTRGDWNGALGVFGDAIEMLCSSPPQSLMAESILLARAYSGQAASFAALGEDSNSRSCAALGRDTVAPWALTNPQCKLLFEECSEMAEHSEMAEVP
jgi:serine/threonine protein kinase